MLLGLFIHSILVILSVVSSVILVFIFISAVVEQENSQNSDMANDLRLQCLLEYGAEVLRDVFRQRWERLTSGGGCGWEDDVANNVERLLQLYGPDKFEHLPLAQQSIIESGNVSHWDLGVLTNLLLQVKFPITGEQVDRKQLTTVRDVWNRNCANPGKGIKESEFKSTWSRAEKALMYFGAAQTKVNAIKQGNAKELAKMVEHCTKTINEENTARAQDLRSQADRHSKSGDFDKAIRNLSDALELSDLGDPDLAALRAERGLALLALINRKQKTSSNEFIRTHAKRAFEDGKKATGCRTEWARGYFVAGQALVFLGQLDKALVQLDLAVGFDSGNKQVQEVRDKCDRKVRGIPEPVAWKPFGPLTELPKIGQEEGADTATTMKYFKKVAGTKGAPAAETRMAEYAIGVMYEQGLGMEAPNFKKAARHYEKGSKLGCGSASYNLGCLYYNGRGVEKNLEPAAAYWTLGAHQGGKFVQFAMRTLCEHYLNTSDGLRANIWYGHALANGYKGDEGEAEKIEQTIRAFQKSGVQTPAKASSPVAALTNPQRAYVVKQYRRAVVSIAAGAKEPIFNGIGTEVQPSEQLPPSKGGPSPMNLLEMDPGHSVQYLNRILRVTCIEDPFPLGDEGSVVLLVEDANRDVVPLKIQNRPEKLEGLSFGSSIQIRDPCVEVLESGDFRILLKDTNTLQLGAEGAPQPHACRFCGKSDAPKPGRCSACKWAWYCGRECQEADRRALGHGMLCKLKIPNHAAMNF